MKKTGPSKTDSGDDKYEVEDSDDTIDGSMGKRVTKFVNILRLSTVEQLTVGRYYITTHDKKYQRWRFFIFIVAFCSSLFTPFEFGFFRGLPRTWWVIDLCVQAIFLADVVVRFFTAYRDPETYRLVVDHRSIALRYIKSDFILDLLGCLPWDTIYKGLGRKEEVRYLVWIRLYRVRKVDGFFERMEKNTHFNYFTIRIMKLLAVEFYCTHTAACIYYYLATTVKASRESYTWIGSLTLGSFSYADFQAIKLVKRYITSLYWAILTMATVGPLGMQAGLLNEKADLVLNVVLSVGMTRHRVFITVVAYGCQSITTLALGGGRADVQYTFDNRDLDSWYWLGRILPILPQQYAVMQGYGDIHAVNVREMIFVMIYVSFDMILGAYLLGNMTALIVKGSNTEKFRDKMTSLSKFMNRNGLPHNIRNQMKSHVRLQFKSGMMIEDEDVLEDLPVSIRTKVAHSRYSHVVEQVSIFKGCSSEFLNEIITRVTEEYFYPGEAVIQQGGASDQFYIVCHGVLEEIFVYEDGKEEVSDLLEAKSVFGEVGMLCSIPQPFTVRVAELCRVLRLDKQSFSDIIQVYFNDGRLVINNLLESKDTDARVGQLAADIALLVAKQAAELALMVNNASYQGDLVQLKHLVKGGAVVARADYDGRTPLHLAASKGFESVVLYLIKEGADVNAIDKFGISPLLEAVRGAHDICVSVLVDHGAALHLQEAGAYLCQTVKNGNNELLRRLLVAGANVSASDYDKRTALHLAAAEGSVGLGKMLLDAGADTSAEDRWGRTALDEAMHHQHAPLIGLLKETACKIHVAPSQALHETNPILRARNLLCPLKGTGESSEDRSDDQGKSEKGHGHIHFPSSPQSTDPYPGTPNRGRLSIMERQSSSDRRLITHVNAMDLEVSPHQYRTLPSRLVGGHAVTEQPLFPQSNRRRVTIFPYHPWTPAKARTPGKVDLVPPTVEEILSLASQCFGKVGSRLLNQDAGQITNTDLIMDSEKIYVVDENDIQRGGLV